MNPSSEYLDKGFVLLKEFVPREVVSAYLSIMQMAVGDTLEKQKRFRLPAHAVTKPSLELFSNNFPFSLGILWGLTPSMEAITGKKLLPSYAYGRVYPKDAGLEVHSDRQSNEHSLNLTLGYADDIAWSFSIETHRQSDAEILSPVPCKDFGDRDFINIDMNPGDAVAYQGVHHRHGRLTPNPNAWSAHLFMGWVERGGAFQANAFDKLELPPKAKFYFD